MPDSRKADAPGPISILHPRLFPPNPGLPHAEPATSSMAPVEGQMPDQSNQLRSPSETAGLDGVLLPREILEAAAEIADGSDVVGLEQSRLERLVSVVIQMDRQ